MMRRLFLFLSLTFLTLSCQAQSWPECLNITYVKAPFNIQNMVMKERALLEKEFEKEGLKINWIPIKAGINQVRGMAAGEIDMVAAMNTSTLLIANANGNKIVIVGGVAHPDDTFAIMAKPEIKSVKDLKNKQIVGPKGTVLHHLLSAALQHEGMTMSDVNWVSMNLPASLTTLLGGRADAALLAAGGVLSAQKAGFHKVTSAKGLIQTNLVLAARADFICSSFSSMSARTALATWPMTGRSSGESLPICLRTAVSSPFLPRYLTRNASSAWLSAACSRADRASRRMISSCSFIVGLLYDNVWITRENIGPNRG